MEEPVYLDKANRHLEGIRPLEGVKKWKKKRSAQGELPKSLSREIEEKKSAKGIPGAAFVKSEYQVACPKLCFLYTVERGQQKVFIEGSGAIGRAEKNDVCIVEDSVSRNHALIDLREGKFFLKDVGSSNGTFMELPSHSNLRKSDCFHIGEHEFEVVHLAVKKNGTFELKLLTKGHKNQPTLSFYGEREVLVGRKGQNVKLPLTGPGI